MPYPFLNFKQTHFFYIMVPKAFELLDIALSEIYYLISTSFLISKLRFGIYAGTKPARNRILADLSLVRKLVKPVPTNSGFLPKTIFMDCCNG